MPVEVIMPKVDMDMIAGTFAVWHVEEGATVVKGDALFDIETDKSAMEVEAPASGRLHHLMAQPGDKIDVGVAVAWIYAEGEAVGEWPGVGASAEHDADAAASNTSTVAASVVLPMDDSAPAATLAASATIAAAAGPATSPTPVATGGLRATPAARHAARDGGIEIASVTGSGPNGRIQRADVDAALSAFAYAPTASGPTAQIPAPLIAREPITSDPSPAAAWTVQPGGLHVSRRKGTGTPLVLIHGFSADSLGWAPFERELPRDIPIIRIDLPSHGRSPRHRITGFADLLRSLTRTFDDVCDGPVHLLGHSLGGALALGIADIRPRQVATLTLLAPAGLGPEIDGAVLNGIARASRVESLAPWLQRLTATPQGISWDFARAAMLSRHDPELRAAQLDLADVLFPDGVQAFDMRAALDRVEAPTALVWGRDDHILPWRQALAAKGEMALHLMSGVGHIPHVERPVDLARIVTRHLDRTK